MSGALHVFIFLSLQFLRHASGTEQAFRFVNFSLLFYLGWFGTSHGVDVRRMRQTLDFTLALLRAWTAVHTTDGLIDAFTKKECYPDNFPNILEVIKNLANLLFFTQWDQAMLFFCFRISLSNRLTYSRLLCLFAARLVGEQRTHQGSRPHDVSLCLSRLALLRGSRIDAKCLSLSNCEGLEGKD